MKNCITYTYNTHLWVAGPYGELTMLTASTMPQAGFDPPAQSDTSYETDALPQSHQGWIFLCFIHRPFMSKEGWVINPFLYLFFWGLRHFYFYFWTFLSG